LVEKSHILDEIRRTADEDGGSPLGAQRFCKATGIRESDWRGRYWANWGDALVEAGYARNEWVAGYTDEHLLEQLMSLMRELGRFPTLSELDLKRRRDSHFPSKGAFTRLGGKNDLAARIVDFCKDRDGYEDVISTCLPLCNKQVEAADGSVTVSDTF
jgi:hypothetical protein